jgi:AcrR family transcriptional regulator
MVERLWTARERREPKLGLSVERIVEAAVALADEDGLVAVSMARVAERLGFTTMALYRHVQSKDELLALMSDAVTEPSRALDDPPEDWREGLERWARALRDALLRHPWYLELPIPGLRMTPNQLAWLDRGLRALAPTKLAEDEKAHVVLLLNGYVFWDVRLTSDLARSDAETDAENARLISQYVDAERYPALRPALDAGIFEDGDDPEEHFRFGLERILDGVERLVTARARRTPARSRTRGRT